MGGGADLGAGQVGDSSHIYRKHVFCICVQLVVQVAVRDHEEVEVLQRDLGSGYTTIRQSDSGYTGFIPTSSLIFH